MKTTDADPSMPLDETTEQTLIRLSDDMKTLADLASESGRAGHSALGAMFDRARSAKAGQAREILAHVTADGGPSAEDRRFLLVRGPVPSDLPGQELARPAEILALTP